MHTSRAVYRERREFTYTYAYTHDDTSDVPMANGKHTPVRRGRLYVRHRRFFVTRFAVLDLSLPTLTIYRDTLYPLSTLSPVMLPPARKKLTYIDRERKEKDLP